MGFNRAGGSKGVLAVIAILVLANVIAWTWFKTGSDNGLPANKAVTPVAPKVSGSAPNSEPLPVDSLWKRYESLNQKSVLEQSGQDQQSAAEARQKEIEAAKAKRDAAHAEREERRAKRKEVLEALRDFNTTIASIEPGDSRKVLSAVEGLNKELTSAGFGGSIDIDLIRDMVEKSERIKVLNAALLKEAGKGSSADGERLSRLSKELGALQSEMPEMLQKITQAKAEAADAGR